MAAHINVDAKSYHEQTEFYLRQKQDKLAIETWKEAYHCAMADLVNIGESIRQHGYVELSMPDGEVLTIVLKGKK